MTTPPDVTARLLRERAAAGTLWLPTSGPSMAPRIVAGDRVRVAVEPRPPRLGEVWAFVTASGDVVVHRYLRRTGLGRLVFVGDRTPAADHPVRPEWVVGRVDAVERRGAPQPLRRRDAVVPIGRAVWSGLRRRIAGRIARVGRI